MVENNYSKAQKTNAGATLMGITKHQIFITLFSCIGQGETHYTRAGRRKIRELLSQWHNKSVGIRWVSRCIKHLVDLGYVTRQVRYTHYDAGLIRQLPSLFAVTYRGADYLFRNMVVGAAKLREVIKAFTAKKDNRWPAKEFTDRDEYRKLYAKEMKRLKRSPAI